MQKLLVYNNRLLFHSLLSTVSALILLPACIAIHCSFLKIYTNSKLNHLEKRLFRKVTQRTWRFHHEPQACIFNKLKIFSIRMGFHARNGGKIGGHQPWCITTNPDLIHSTPLRKSCVSGCHVNRRGHAGFMSSISWVSPSKAKPYMLWHFPVVW